MNSDLLRAWEGYPLTHQWGHKQVNNRLQLQWSKRRQLRRQLVALSTAGFLQQHPPATRTAVVGKWSLTPRGQAWLQTNPFPLPSISTAALPISPPTPPTPPAPLTSLTPPPLSQSALLICCHPSVHHQSTNRSHPSSVALPPLCCSSSASWTHLSPIHYSSFHTPPLPLPLTPTMKPGKLNHLPPSDCGPYLT